MGYDFWRALSPSLQKSSNNAYRTNTAHLSFSSIFTLSTIIIFYHYLHHQPRPQAERLAEAFFLDDTGDIKAVILDGVKQLLFLLIEARFKSVLVLMYPFHDSRRFRCKPSHLLDGADIAIVEFIPSSSLLGNTQYRRGSGKSRMILSAKGRKSLDFPAPAR